MASARPQQPARDGTWEQIPLSRDCFKVDPKKITDTMVVSAYQHLGDRKSQEDRFVVASWDRNRALFGVFDGTVGDFASDNVMKLAAKTLIQTDSWRAIEQSPSMSAQDVQVHAEKALTDMYRNVDRDLIQRCADNRQHYSTCTSVTALVVRNFLVLGHIGDSRIVSGFFESNSPLGSFETQDHKPDLEHERNRIEASGGSVECLQNHGNKPYIRGGDFMLRKALGEQPMQLQYSRAFGGKDLKMFGLTCIPDVKVIDLTRRRPQYVVLATDGIWDVVEPNEAISACHRAVKESLNPAEEVVKAALLKQSSRRAKSDNVTAVVVQLL